MRTEDDIREQWDALMSDIIEELRTPTNDPREQWASLKVLQAKRDALEWVLGRQEVI